MLRLASFISSNLLEAKFALNMKTEFQIGSQGLKPRDQRCLPVLTFTQPLFNSSVYENLPGRTNMTASERTKNLLPCWVQIMSIGAARQTVHGKVTELQL